MYYLPSVVGICGNIGAGKNEVAQWLNKQFGYVIRGYSDPLYRQLALLDPYIVSFDRSYLAGWYTTLRAVYGHEYMKRNYSEVRRYLRLLGSECGRDIHGADCWVRRMDIDRKDDIRTVIQGVRFTNEVEHIKGLGGVMIWVSAPDRETPPEDHVSENAINYAEVADYCVLNNGTLQALHTDLQGRFNGTL